MIRAQAVDQHQAETGHNLFRGTTDDTGRVVCTQCPWQYPPAPDQQQITVIGGPYSGTTLETHQTATVIDRHGLPVSEVDRPTLLPVDPPPTDPQPAMGPAPEPPCTDCGRPADDPDPWCAKIAENHPHWPNPTPAEADPGPVPDDQPDIPPLNLKSRIDNAIERGLTEQGQEHSDVDMIALADVVFAAVAAGADYSERTENTEMTPAQALAWLLDKPEWDRVNRLGILMDQARKASDCFVMDHEGAVEMRQAMLIRERRHFDALTRIARLCSPPEPPLTQAPLLDQIGQIAAEALVRE